MKLLSGESLAGQFSQWGYECSFVDCIISPQIIRYNFNLANILQLQKIKKLCENLSALLRLNVDYATSDTSDFALLVERKQRAIDYLETYNELLEANRDTLSFPIGLDTNSNKVITNLDRTMNLLVGGTSGCGKSTYLNSMILSLCSYNSTDKLGLVLIDTKRVSFAKYRHLPHLVYEVALDKDTALSVLQAVEQEMNRRYEIMEKLNIEKITVEMKHICVIIDEVSDLVASNDETRNQITSMLRKCRACGIHFVICTQSVRCSVLSGEMLANLQTRLALTCANVRESVLVLGHKDAEKLTGNGDGIFKSADTVKEQRVQTPYMPIERILELVN